MYKEADIRFNVPTAKRWLLFLCVTLLCYIMASIVSCIVMHGELSAAKVYIGTMVQDVVLFILPALITALIITRRSADFLTLSVKPTAMNLMLALTALLVSIPAVNVVVEWNAGVALPEWMGDAEEWMRSSEESAAGMISLMVKGRSVVNLIMLLLVVGVLAGFSEELFFRGTVQRLMITSNINPHVAVWFTAFIFSAFHMQFFGFVPRLLLGAMFGYMAWWTGSIWISSAAHILNNFLAATVMWCSAGGQSEDIANVDKIGTGNPFLSIISVAATILLLLVLYRLNRIGSQHC